MKLLAKWFKKSEGDKLITTDEAVGLWLTCPKWLGDILARLDNRIGEVDAARLNQGQQFLETLEVLANRDDQLLATLTQLADRVHKLELALIEADQALVQATVGQAREGARH